MKNVVIKTSTNVLITTVIHKNFCELVFPQLWLMSIALSAFLTIYSPLTGLVEWIMGVVFCIIVLCDIVLSCVVFRAAIINRFDW